MPPGGGGKGEGGVGGGELRPAGRIRKVTERPRGCLKGRVRSLRIRIENANILDSGAPSGKRPGTLPFYLEYHWSLKLNFRGTMNLVIMFRVIALRSMLKREHCRRSNNCPCPQFLSPGRRRGQEEVPSSGKSIALFFVSAAAAAAMRAISRA